MTTGTSRGVPQGVPVERQADAHMTGWVVFGGVTLVVIGAMNFLQGVTLLDNDEFLVNQYLYDNLTFWGWAFLVFGLLQAVAGVFALAGTSWGPSLGIVLGAIAAIGWFFMIFAAPAAAIVGIALSVAIMASLSTAFSD